MTSQLVACDRCGAVFVRLQVQGAEKCFVCDHRGPNITYVDGSESRKEWFSRVDLSEVGA